MNTKHTPGPWIARQVAPQSQFSKFYVWQIVGEPTECASTLVCTLPDYSKDNSSNARLIAACPELLVALQRAVEQFDYTVKSMALGHTVSISSLQNCAAMARQAIAKATGAQC